MPRDRYRLLVAATGAAALLAGCVKQAPVAPPPPEVLVLVVPLPAAAGCRGVQETLWRQAEVPFTAELVPADTLGAVPVVAGADPDGPPPWEVCEAVVTVLWFTGVPVTAGGAPATSSGRRMPFTT